MKIAQAGPVEIDLTGRTLTVYEYDSQRETDHVSTFELDAITAGLVIDQIASVMEVIAPGSLLAGWLQKAFNSGLDVGRNENAAPAVESADLCGSSPQTQCAPGCCNGEA